MRAVLLKLSCKIKAQAFILLFLSTNVFGNIVDHYIADVTPNSFTVIFTSTDPIVSPSLKVFESDSGVTEVSVSYETISNSLQHQNGIAVLRLQSLPSSTNFYFQFTDDVNSVNYYPINGLSSVSTLPNSVNSSISDLNGNDLIKLDVYRPEQISSLEGAVVLLSLPQSSLHPVTSLVGGNDFAYVDANNLLQSDSSIHTLSEGQNIEVKVLRGRLCAGSVDHLQVFYRKHGEDLEEGVQVNLAQHCNAVDTVCDDQINVLDVQFALNAINSTPSECRFSEDLDVVQDEQINVLDIQQILNFF